MKIAFVVGNLDMGGLEKVTVYIVNELAKQYEIDLIILKKNYHFYNINNNVNVIEAKINYSFIDKIKRRLYRNIVDQYQGSFFKEINYLKSQFQKKKYHKIIAVDGSNAMIVNTVLKGLRKYTPEEEFITWIHNNCNTYFNNYFKDYQKELKDALAKSSYVVTLTKSDEEEYGKLCKINNTITIYNPITINPNNKSNLKKKEILFVARLVKEHKGLEYLVEIAKKIKGSEWIIRVVGDGIDRLWLEEQIFENNLDDILILQGSVKENIEDYYRNASIFISTSKWEGLPLVMIEAISSGLPIISFNHSGAREILGDNKYGILVEMGHIDSFYEKLQVLMSSETQRNFWAQKSLERSSTFRIDYIRNEWMKIIK